MSNNIKNLIIEVTNTLTEYAEGKLAYDDALNNYKRLTGKYGKIKGKHKTKDSTNHIEGLCYHNNIENFSLLSGIYRIEKQDIYPLAAYGDTSLNSWVMSTIFNNTGIIGTNKTIKIPPSGDSEFSHNIYIYPIDPDNANKVLFASISSSTFFSEDKFMFIGKLIKNIFNLFMFTARVYENDYFYKISNEINDYIKENLNDKYFVRVNLFVFNMINKLFDHMGDDALQEINNLICNILKNYFKQNSECYSLSIKDYIAIEKINRTDTQKEKKAKPEFSYKNINITYQSLKLDIETEEPDFSLWDKILTFENYLRTGDIIR